MEIMSITQSLKDNEEFLKNKIGESFDIKYRHFKISAFGDTDALIAYINEMTDTRVIDETILEPLIKNVNIANEKKHIKIGDYKSLLMESGVFTADVKESSDWEEVMDAISEGDTALFIDKCDTVLILATKHYDGRSVSEPTGEGEIKGPRDGFVENVIINAGLIRRRIKDYGLRFDKMTIGERTKTVVLVAYIMGIANEELIKEVKKRLKKIKIDAILASAYIAELIEEPPLSIFPKITDTERPDKVCASLLEGRVAILVDNTPYVLVAPATFWQFFTSSGDYYERYFLATFVRWIRYIALFLSVSTASIYVLLSSFHHEMLPTSLALKIAAGRNGVPFPAVLEAFFMEIMLEIMKEAGLRLPKPIGQTVSIVGALVIGQGAVAAGLVGPFLVIAIAISAISSFAISSYSMGNAFRIVRFPILVSTAFFGLLGYLAGIIVLLLHLMSLRSFGVSYLAPVIPFEKDSNKDVLLRAPWWKMTKRPNFLKPKDSRRQAFNKSLKPFSKK